MVVFFHLPLEIRLLIYAQLELLQQKPIPWGKHFAVEPPYRFPPHLLEISHQISQEVLIALPPDHTRPWKINVFADRGTKLSLPDTVPIGLARSAHIQFHLEFPSYRDTSTQSRPLLVFTQSEALLKRVGCGIEEICRVLAGVPVRRDIEVCWSNYGVRKSWESRENLLRPLSKLRSLCTFSLGKVIGEEEQELALQLEVVTVRVQKRARLT